MGHAGAPQLDVCHVAVAVQVHDAGVIQPDPVLIFPDPVGGQQTRVGLDGHILRRDAVIECELRHTPAAVAAHLAPTAICVVEMELKIRDFGVVHSHKAVTFHFFAQLLCKLGEIQSKSTGIDDHKIIARTGHVPCVHKVSSVVKKHVIARPQAVAIPEIKRRLPLELAGKSTGLPEGELPRRGKRGHPGVRQCAHWLAMTLLWV